TSALRPGLRVTHSPRAPVATSHRSAARRKATCQRLTATAYPARRRGAPWGRPPGAPRADGRLGRSGRLADAHPPRLGPLLQVLPLEQPGALRLELVVERLRVVVVDQLERLPRLQVVERLEQQRVAVAGADGAYVDLLHRFS